MEDSALATNSSEKDMLVNLETPIASDYASPRLRPLLEAYSRKQSAAKDREAVSEINRSFDVRSNIEGIATARSPIKISSEEIQGFGLMSARPFGDAKTDIGFELQGSQTARKTRSAAITPRTLGRRIDAFASKQFTTSYGNEFFKKSFSAAEPVTERPRSSYPYGGCYNLSDPIGVTSYSVHFAPKPPYARTPELRSGSASGDRANNPHPSKEFLVWRYPNRARISDSRKSMPLGEERRPSVRSWPTQSAAGQGTQSNAEIDKVNLKKYTTIYREDYQKPPDANIHMLPEEEVYPIGSPASGVISAVHDNGGLLGTSYGAAPLQPILDPVHVGTGDKSILGLPYRVRLMKPPYAIDSMQRIAYRPREVQSVLAVPTTRFESNQEKKKPAVGLIPISSELYMRMKARTTYDRDVNDRVLKFYYGAEDVRSLSSSRNTLPMRGRAFRNDSGSVNAAESQGDSQSLVG